MKVAYLSVAVLLCCCASALAAKANSKNLLERLLEAAHKKNGAAAEAARELHARDVLISLLKREQKKLASQPKAKDTAWLKDAARLVTDGIRYLTDHAKAAGNLKALTATQITDLVKAKSTLQEKVKTSGSRVWMDSAIDGLMTGIDVIIETFAGDKKTLSRENLAKINNVKSNLKKCCETEDGIAELMQAIDELVTEYQNPGKKGWWGDFTDLIMEGVGNIQNWVVGNKSHIARAKVVSVKLLKAKDTLAKLKAKHNAKGAMDGFIDGLMVGIDTITGFFSGDNLSADKLSKLKKSLSSLKAVGVSRGIDELMQSIDGLIQSALEEGTKKKEAKSDIDDLMQSIQDLIQSATPDKKNVAGKSVLEENPKNAKSAKFDFDIDQWMQDIQNLIDSTLEGAGIKKGAKFDVDEWMASIQDLIQSTLEGQGKKRGAKYDIDELMQAIEELVQSATNSVNKKTGAKFDIDQWMQDIQNLIQSTLDGAGKMRGAKFDIDQWMADIQGLIDSALETNGKKRGAKIDLDELMNSIQDLIQSATTEKKKVAGKSYFENMMQSMQELIQSG